MTIAEKESYISVAAERVNNILISRGIHIPEEKICSSVGYSHTSIIFEFNTKFNMEKYKEQFDKAYDKFYDDKHITLTKHGIKIAFTYEELDKEDTESSEAEMKKIMDKIDKLLKMTTENGATENEAIVASMKAQKLMKQYDIDYYNFSGEKAQEEICTVAYEFEDSYKFKLEFASSVARSYRCNAYVTGNRIVKFRGHKNDALIARRMFAFLYKTMIKLGKKYDYEQKKYDEQVLGIHHTSKFKSYCVGFIYGVDKELKENCHILSLVTPEDVAEEWQTYSRNMNMTKANYKYNNLSSKAVQDGIDEGKKVMSANYVTTDANALDTN